MKRSHSRTSSNDTSFTESSESLSSVVLSGSAPDINRDSWAPKLPSHSAYKHLPEPSHDDTWRNGMSSDPNTAISVQAKELEYSVQRLVTPMIFEAFLRDEQGRKNFRNYLLSKWCPLAAAALDMWWDLTLLGKLNDKAKCVAAGVKDAYLSVDSEFPVALPSAMVNEVYRSLRSIAEVSGLEKSSQHLLDGLYSNEFQVRPFPYQIPTRLQSLTIHGTHRAI